MLASNNRFVLRGEPFCSPTPPMYTEPPCMQVKRRKRPPATLEKLPAVQKTEPTVSEGMRKVQSLDFDALRKKEEDLPCVVASQFSRSTHRRRSSRKRRGSFRLPTLPAEDDTVDTQDDDDSSTMLFWTRPFRGPWTILTVLMLLSFGNFALQVVHAQMHQVDFAGDYDALSTEVIKPPFRYKTSATGPRKGLSLGSAAISSVTTALSPILPFTGGVDLRREELWTEHKSWFDTATSVVEHVRDAFGLDTGTSVLPSIPRGGSQQLKKSSSPKQRKRSSHRPTPISESKPFVPISNIADFTLSDLTSFFQYAKDNHRPGFEKNKFLSSTSDRVKPALQKMDQAVHSSRGADVLPALTRKDSQDFGDVDALQFCAAMRIFAEWRMVRQVPDGYKGYAVGMNLGHKDIVQNLHKMEHAVHDYIDYRREVIEMEQDFGEVDVEELRAPTLRELLQHEIDTQVHTRLPRLKEKSSAMGLLWVRRQLHYQTSLFANILQVPDTYPTTNAAVSQAYRQVYGQYHGWAVQKIFNYSFQAAPQVKEIYKFMNPHKLKEVQEAAQKLKQRELATTLSVVDEDVSSSQSQKDSSARHMNPFERFGHHIGSEFDKFGKHIGGEWDKLIDTIVRVFDQDSQKRSIRGGHQGLEEEQLDLFIATKMQEDAHQHIVVYLDSVEPLLEDLAGLFDDLNMDDPTKV